MQSDSRWSRFRRRLRYWLDRSERNRRLWEEMEFHIALRNNTLDSLPMSSSIDSFPSRHECQRPSAVIATILRGARIISAARMRALF